ncbi:MAG TPA: polymer-forming cytoskeletal protein [Candidatus Saccharicenans sp.]|nr:polymer-forming cytoskeletal protein [Candidatus Saccharicenans sp.]HRD01264.1 polymer-forming cytoskeletal protein [Candidatus Saccharicenans sp.]
MSPDEKKLTAETAPPKASSRVGTNLVLEGKLTGHEDLEISGQVNGSIDLALHDLVIQKSGRVKAEFIKVKNLFIHGQLDGQVKAERIVISETAVFSGDITATRLSVQSGAKFKGTVKISKDYQP